MTELTVSVVIVSYDRPNDLALCLKALSYQYRRNFEIVVVHNSTSKAGVDASGLASEIKTIEYDTPNISAARNLGMAAASGEIIAFIDDDAIAEPTWLLRLIEPFSSPTVSASSGFVIGRNGFDIQWGGEIVDDYGRATDLSATEMTVIKPKPNTYPKTHGTNCAFRRSMLEQFGGFDENYHFYLDETDLNVRMGKAGLSVAVAPKAEVHHAFSASRLRSTTRVPKTLFEIGASTAYFLKKHELSFDYLDEVRIEQRNRLEHLLVAGHLEPRDISILMSTLEKGFEEGDRRKPERAKTTQKTLAEFKAFRPYSPLNYAKFLSCRRLFSHKARHDAAKLATAGAVVTLLEFSWTILRHRRFFHPDGYWVQAGGMFGKSDRGGQPFQIHTLRSRAAKEKAALINKRSFA